MRFINRQIHRQIRVVVVVVVASRYITWYELKLQVEVATGSMHARIQAQIFRVFDHVRVEYLIKYLAAG